MDIFEKASREKLRFPSTKGDLATEQLWDLPLTARTGPSLDNVAKAVNASLKAAGEESFVEVKTNPAKALHELRLDIVKHVIAEKQADLAKRNDAAERAEKREKLRQILRDKQDDSLKSLTEAEIEARLRELD